MGLNLFKMLAQNFLPPKEYCIENLLLKPNYEMDLWRQNIDISQILPEHLDLMQNCPKVFGVNVRCLQLPSLIGCLFQIYLGKVLLKYFTIKLLIIPVEEPQEVSALLLIWGERINLKLELTNVPCWDTTLVINITSFMICNLIEFFIAEMYCLKRMFFPLNQPSCT